MAIGIPGLERMEQPYLNFINDIFAEGPARGGGAQGSLLTMTCTSIVRKLEITKQKAQIRILLHS